jgi:hypothetical protein
MKTLEAQVNELEKNDAIMRSELDQQKSYSEKNDRHFEDFCTKITTLELKLEGWLKYFKGTLVATILCCGLIGSIGGWTYIRNQDMNDKINDEQNKMLYEQGRSILDINNQLKTIIDIIGKKL